MDGFIERVESGAVFSGEEISWQREVVAEAQNVLAAAEVFGSDAEELGGKQHLLMQENRLALMLLCNRVAGMMGRPRPSRGFMTID